MNYKNPSNEENSLSSIKKKKEFSINESILSSKNKNSVGDMTFKSNVNQFDPSISFINDISTMSHSILADSSVISEKNKKTKQTKKKLKKPNKILGFFKKMVKKISKKKKNKKKNGKQINFQESFISSIPNKSKSNYSQAKVDFSKAEIFSNE